MADSYRRVKGGSLKLKGGLKKKKRKQDVAVAETVQVVEEEVEVRAGTGRVSSSGTVITGHETAFMDELRSGDALIVAHPTTLVDETRIVTMVVSNVSISVSSAFSSDLVSTCAFRYVSAPRDYEETPEMRAIRLKNQEAAQQDAALGDYGSSNALVYRKRKKGVVGGSNGYEIIREKLDDDKSRTELLDMRIKHKSDRHCA